ncbi:hypothetical protein BB560_001638 [Smittium megazygosporum]|uniref:Uncharacterized protein n=1 Tax=Smittium megazygosporum TaxID=133381 RepID=A0A2T9ZGX5_9FUNG|nr:hypothetical protein BB560_001638 [Smittium megazygosporum]
MSVNLHSSDSESDSEYIASPKTPLEQNRHRIPNLMDSTPVPKLRREKHLPSKDSKKSEREKSSAYGRTPYLKTLISSSNPLFSKTTQN